MMDCHFCDGQTEAYDRGHGCWAGRCPKCGAETDWIWWNKADAESRLHDLRHWQAKRRDGIFADSYGKVLSDTRNRMVVQKGSTGSDLRGPNDVSADQ